MEQRKIPNGTQFLQALFYIYFQLQDKAWQHKRVYEFRPAVIESCKKFFNRFRKIYEEVGETELMAQYKKPSKLKLKQSHQLKKKKMMKLYGVYYEKQV